ncbi:MAG: helix-turn-helix domain-containing protein [Flavobacteriales bacterium]|nr:helix-turn-helix domain-containing protein [Flavobacteriales bacterium]
MMLSENIRFLRKDLGLTQSELAERLGVNRPVIGAYEEGRAEPRIQTLKLMAYFFKVSVDDLLDKDLSTGEHSSDISGKSLRILTVPVENEAGEERATLVPVKAAAGYLTGFGDMEFVGALPKFSMPFPELPADRTYRVFQIEGDSMLPVPPKSYVIAEYVQDWTDLKTDERYVFLTKDEGVVFKRVRTHAHKRSYELISDNSVYKPYFIKQSQVLEVWRVRGVIGFDLDAFQSTSASMKDVLAAIERIEKKL